VGFQVGPASHYVINCYDKLGEGVHYERIFANLDRGH